MQIFTVRRFQIFDLVVVSLLVLFAWHTTTGSCWVLSYAVLRLLVSLSLIERQRSVLWPLLLFTASSLVVVSGAVPFSLPEVFYTQFRSFGLLGGYDVLRPFASGAEFQQQARFALQSQILQGYTLVSLIWLHLYPWIAYLRLWRGRKFQADADARWVYGGLAFLVLALGSTLVCSHVTCYGQTDAYPLWILVLFTGLLTGLFFKVRLEASLLHHYVLLVLLGGSAYLVGIRCDAFLSLWGLLLFPVLGYVAACHFCPWPVQRPPLVLMAFSGLFYWISQYGTGALRYSLLALSVGLTAYVCVQLYRPLRQWSRAFSLFVLLGLVLPLLTLGYNPFTVAGAARWYDFQTYVGTRNGVFVVREGDQVGLRDRFGEILPCRYDQLKTVGDGHRPYLQVRQDSLWGLYRLVRNQLLYEPQFTSITAYNSSYLKLVSPDARVLFYRESFEELGRFNPQESYVYTAPYDCMLDWPLALILEGDRLTPVPCQLEMKRILCYLSSSYGGDSHDLAAHPENGLRAAEKCRRYISRVLREEQLYWGDSLPDFAVIRRQITLLLSKLDEGTLIDRGIYASLMALLQLHETLDDHIVWSDTTDFRDAYRKEALYWMQSFFTGREFYDRNVLLEEDYTRQLLVRAAKARHFLTRRAQLQEREQAFWAGKPQPVYKGPEVTDEQLLVQLRQLSRVHFNSDLLDKYRAALMQWLHYRAQFAESLDPGLREGYRQLNRQIRANLYHDLKDLVREDTERMADSQYASLVAILSD